MRKTAIWATPLAALVTASCGGEDGGPSGGSVAMVIPTPTPSPSPATPTPTPTPAPSPTATLAPAATAIVAHEFDSQTTLNSFLTANIATDLRDRFTTASGIMRVAIVPSDIDFSMGNVSEHPIVIATGLTEATLEYRFRFSPQFEFVRQGKLPGIASLSPHFGGSSNSPPASDSWSFRQMWLKFSSDPVASTARPDMYLYDQYRVQGQFGEHYRAASGTEFVPGQWYVARMYIRLNSKNAVGVAQLDGSAELWRDDAPLVCNTGLKIRGDNFTDSSLLRRIAYHFYHGGARTPSELPSTSVDQWIEFDYIRLYDGRATPKNADGSFRTCDRPNPNKPDYP